MVLNLHYESCNNFKMVLNSHYESCNNFEMVMIFAEKHRTYDGIGMFIDQCKREAISNIFQTNKFNFSTLYCCFSLIQPFLLFSTLSSGLEILDKTEYPSAEEFFLRCSA